MRRESAWSLGRSPRCHVGLGHWRHCGRERHQQNVERRGGPEDIFKACAGKLANTKKRRGEKIIVAKEGEGADEDSLLG